MQERGLAGVVEAEEEDLGLLLPQPQRRQHPVEPVHQEHLLPPTRSPDDAGALSLPASGSPEDEAAAAAATRREEHLTDLGEGGVPAAEGGEW